MKSPLKRVAQVLCRAVDEEEGYVSDGGSDISRDIADGGMSQEEASPYSEEEPETDEGVDVGDDSEADETDDEEYFFRDDNDRSTEGTEDILHPLNPADFQKVNKDEVQRDYGHDPYPYAPLRAEGVHVNLHKHPGEVFLGLMKESLRIARRETNRQGKVISRNSKREFRKKPKNRGKDPPKSMSWPTLTYAEFCLFLGILFLQGLCIKTTLYDYWSMNPMLSTPIFATLMSRHRFLQILHALHFCDSDAATNPMNQNFTGKGDRNNRNYDNLNKIRRFWEKAFEKFEEAFQPGQGLSIDEQVVPFTGHYGYRVNIPSKPNPVGLKVYSICDAKTGYNLRSELWHGQFFPKEKMGRGYSTTYAIVWDLLKKGNRFKQNHRLFTDNYYTSRRLWENLYWKKVFCCGTVKGTHGLPKEFCTQKEHWKRGKAKYMMAHNKCPIFLVNWRDKKNVCLLWTLPGLTCDETVVKRKLVQKAQNGELMWNARGRVKVPEIVIYYNAFMGGVDMADQMRFYATRHYRTARWYIAAFFYVLKTAVANTHIMYRELFKIDDQKWKQFTINQCQLQIACHLVNEGRKERGLSPVKLHDLIETMNSQKLSRRKGNPVTTPKKHPATGDLMEKRFIPQLNHMPVPTVGKDGTLYHRQQCAWCSLQKKKKQTWWKCIACDKPLCLNHWVHYHTPALPQSQAHRRDRIIETANGHDLGAEETTQNKEGRKQQKRKSMGMEANLDQSSKKCRRTLNFDS